LTGRLHAVRNDFVHPPFLISQRSQEGFREETMPHSSFPVVQIERQDHLRLKELARTAEREGHPTAPFLLAEIRRAKVFDTPVPEMVEETAGLNKQVSFRIDFGPTRRRLFVLPEHYSNSELEVSVLSPVGAAILGLRKGDRMPYRDIFGALHFVTIMDVEPLTPSFTASPGPQDPTDPGPQAA
jgi:regulator of nucleoside diphosphate kinase